MAKNYVDVVIDNKVLSLGGSDKEGYYQQVANYVNEKIGNLRSEPGFNQQTRDYQNILIYLNIADDYLKAKTRFEEVCALVDKQAKDVYKLKHDLVADKIRIEKLEKELAAAKAELKAAQGKPAARKSAVKVEEPEGTEPLVISAEGQKLTAMELASMDAETPMLDLEFESGETVEAVEETPVKKTRKRTTKRTDT